MRHLSLRLSLLAALGAAAPVLAQEEAAKPEPVQVFILAGQSNMVGAGIVPADPNRNEGKGTLEWCVKNHPKLFGRLVDDDGNWIVRDDCFVSYFDKRGGLTVGFGGRENQIGPELGFGMVMAENYDEPVLLIKVAWGGKSIGKDFRPPSAGGEVGEFYTKLVEQVRNTLANIGDHVPGYQGQGYALVGFGWHQGWNDRINQAFNDAYEENLSCFIRDIRKDLEASDLPFVIAETGMSRHEEKHPRALSLMAAQAAVAEREEFRNNVAFVGTRDFYRPKEESPSGQAYHWNNNAETYYRIGEGMGKAMLELVRDAR